MKPYKFKPFLKPTIWGGDNIAAFKHLSTARHDIGESWEISGIAGHESITVERGLKDDVDVGLTLTQLIQKHQGQLLGHRVYSQYGTNFPLLIKFIDSRQDLSVQVHPNDELAQRRHHCPGKTEMWYVINANEGARIYAGLAKPITPEDYERMVCAEGHEGHAPIMDVIASHEAHCGDLFFLPAGRLHAIGAGCFLCEIQQSSDITYRVYDYDRRDANGQKRELHVEQAKEAIDYRVAPAYRQSYDSTQTVATLVDCPWFSVKRIVVQTALEVDLHTDSFVIVVCINGQANINGVDILQGETILVPASENILRIFGNATFLSANV